MNKIINKEILAQGIIRLTIDSEIANKAAPGQFVIVLTDERGERIPLTLADWDAKSRTISLIFQQVGLSTGKLADLNIGHEIYGILGPLGRPTQLHNFGTVLCIGGGVGIAEIYPVSRGLKQVGNEVIGIIGVRTKDLLILENEMKGVCDQIYVATDDGSYGVKGTVGNILEKVLAAEKHINLVYCIGPLVMMQAVSRITKPLGIKTIVSLNPIMVDATGMCGSCRVSVGGKTYFACVDGPDFDAHQVDFAELITRLKLFKDQEECSAKNCPNRAHPSA